jgi:hypothetical protein
MVNRGKGLHFIMIWRIGFEVITRVLDKHVKKGFMGGMGSDFTDPEWPRRKMFFRP